MLKGVIFDMILSNRPTLAGLFEKDGHPEVPYVKDFIRGLKASGLKLAIASSSPLPVIRQVMEEFSLTDCFEALVSGSTLPHPKPAPDIFLLAAKELGLSPSECIVIEDSEAGTLAAKAAGIPCIGFVNPHSGKQNLSSAYALLESFENADAAYLRRTHAHALGSPADILETERLFLREFSTEDFPTLYAMYTAPETAVWMDEPLSDYETEKEKHRAYVSNVYPLFDLALWGIYEKASGNLIGRAGFSLPKDESDTYSVGYFIDTPFRNKGYAKECIPALLSYAKEQGTTSVVANIKKDNHPSRKILEACGYSYETEAESPDGILTYRISL